METILVIFTLVYITLAFGYLPGFHVDRTGAAIVGAMAMIGFGKISPQEAWYAIDYATIGLLFGLMIVSGAFTISGFYAWTAAHVASLKVSPNLLLALLIILGAVLSSLLTNDVVVVAMTPLLVSITLSRGLNPIPFLLGFCFATNTGATATLIGSPNNIIVAQALHLSFVEYMGVAVIPAVLSLLIVWAVIVFIYRKNWTIDAPELPNMSTVQTMPTVDMVETIKAAVVVAAVIYAFVFTDFPREISALMGAAVILINRKVSPISSKEVLGTVDGNLLLLLAGLFIVNAALTKTGLPGHLITHLQHQGVELTNPSVLFLLSSFLSNIVGNNPAVMLLVPFIPGASNATALGAALALGTGFSSNMIIFGSLAGIIVVEQAAAHGVKITMREFCRAGLPVSILCMVLALVWLAFL